MIVALIDTYWWNPIPSMSLFAAYDTGSAVLMRGSGASSINGRRHGEAAELPTVLSIEL